MRWLLRVPAHTMAEEIGIADKGKIVVNRRTFLWRAGAATAAAGLSTSLFADGEPAPHALLTPYKLNRLVLAGSGTAGTFDEKFVDGPFVFRHEEEFRLTYIGFDGNGYQTGMARSHDLVNWTRMGCILPRQPQSPIFRYNVAMMWIVRENSALRPARLKKIRGRYLGAWQRLSQCGDGSWPCGDRPVLER